MHGWHQPKKSVGMVFKIDRNGIVGTWYLNILYFPIYRNIYTKIPSTIPFLMPVV